MVNVGLMVHLEAKPGKADELQLFLQEHLNHAQEEPDTTAWFAMRLGPRSFAIFDAFPDDSGREAHLTGQIAEDFKAATSDLLAKAPVIEKVDVIAAKIPDHAEVPDSLG